LNDVGAAVPSVIEVTATNDAGAADAVGIEVADVDAGLSDAVDALATDAVSATAAVAAGAAEAVGAAAADALELQFLKVQQRKMLAAAFQGRSCSVFHSLGNRQELSVSDTKD
jgi:hypothetical protein